MMFRKIRRLWDRIDHVQQEVTSLIGLLDGVAKPDDGFFRQTYGLSGRQCERLGVLILKHQDACLSGREQRRLGRWAGSCDGAARYCLDFQELTLMLQAYFRFSATPSESGLRHHAPAGTAPKTSR